MLIQCLFALLVIDLINTNVMANPLTNAPVSEILKNASTFEDEPRKKSREDWRKAKELEEARKAGTAPAAVDEEGKDINPHIPQYISATPWYFGAHVSNQILYLIQF
jgi:pre-mRNA-processing factor SLU7